MYITLSTQHVLQLKLTREHRVSLFSLHASSVGRVTYERVSHNHASVL
jgi:hypothetical protein